METCSLNVAPVVDESRRPSPWTPRVLFSSSPFLPWLSSQGQWFNSAPHPCLASLAVPSQRLPPASKTADYATASSLSPTLSGPLHCVPPAHQRPQAYIPAVEPSTPTYSHMTVSWESPWGPPGEPPNPIGPKQDLSLYPPTLPWSCQQGGCIVTYMGRDLGGGIDSCLLQAPR